MLLSRERKRVQLTPEGEGLFLLTKQFFEIEEQIENYMSQSRATIEGTLRIIVDNAYFVTDILGRFRAHYPNVHISLRTGNSADVLKTLRAYDAEIGVVGSLSPESDMRTLGLGSSPIVAFAARGKLDDASRPRTLRELAEMPLVFREKGSKTRQNLEAEAKRQGVLFHPVIEVEGREALREIVAAGGGVGFVSRAEFGHDSRIEEIPLKNTEMSMSEALVHLSQRRDVRLIQAFMRFAENPEL